MCVFDFSHFMQNIPISLSLVQTGPILNFLDLVQTKPMSRFIYLPAHQNYVYLYEFRASQTNVKGCPQILLPPKLYNFQFQLADTEMIVLIQAFSMCDCVNKLNPALYYCITCSIVLIRFLVGVARLGLPSI